ncbi:MAG: hypothetical protein GY866_20500 [Proteobacteria bacterium]|nr:hypothetical protein [Pseudomonadota bacterium]
MHNKPINILITTGKVAGLSILGIFLIFLSILFYFFLSFQNDLRVQRNRVKAFLSLPAMEEHASNPFVNDRETDPRLNEIQLIASHNSYHSQPDAVRLFFVGLVDPPEVDKMKYSHAPLHEQFELGVRSIELDIRRKENRFEIVHVPLVGNRGHSPDFILALKEINAWSNRRPDHVPILVLLELKSDWMFLDPWLLPFDADALEALDSAVRSVFPEDKLVTPDTIRIEGNTLEQSVRTAGWPRLSECRGKVLFILHEEKELRELYIRGRPNLEGRTMFTCAEPGQPDAAIILHNEPDTELIRSFVKAGYLVRTRADKDLIPNRKRWAQALGSGAQILTTDYPPGEPHTDTGDIFTFGKGKTVRLNPVFFDR